MIDETSRDRVPAFRDTLRLPAGEQREVNARAVSPRTSVGQPRRRSLLERNQPCLREQLAPG
jgi:hypothetical protein